MKKQSTIVAPGFIPSFTEEECCVQRINGPGAWGSAGKAPRRTPSGKSEVLTSSPFDIVVGQWAPCLQEDIAFIEKFVPCKPHGACFVKTPCERGKFFVDIDGTSFRVNPTCDPLKIPFHEHLAKSKRAYQSSFVGSFAYGEVAFAFPFRDGVLVVSFPFNNLLQMPHTHNEINPNADVWVNKWGFHHLHAIPSNRCSKGAPLETVLSEMIHFLVHTQKCEVVCHAGGPEGQMASAIAKSYGINLRESLSVGGRVPSANFCSEGEKACHLHTRLPRDIDPTGKMHFQHCPTMELLSLFVSTETPASVLRVGPAKNLPSGASDRTVQGYRKVSSSRLASKPYTPPLTFSANPARADGPPDMNLHPMNKRSKDRMDMRRSAQPANTFPFPEDSNARRKHTSQLPSRDFCFLPGIWRQKFYDKPPRFAFFPNGSRKKKGPRRGRKSFQSWNSGMKNYRRTQVEEARPRPFEKEKKWTQIPKKAQAEGPFAPGVGVSEYVDGTRVEGKRDSPPPRELHAKPHFPPGFADCRAEATINPKKGAPPFPLSEGLRPPVVATQDFRPQVSLSGKDAICDTHWPFLLSKFQHTHRRSPTVSTPPEEKEVQSASAGQVTRPSPPPPPPPPRVSAEIEEILGVEASPVEASQTLSGPIKIPPHLAASPTKTHHVPGDPLSLRRGNCEQSPGMVTTLGQGFDSLNSTPGAFELSSPLAASLLLGSPCSNRTLWKSKAQVPSVEEFSHRIAGSELFGDSEDLPSYEDLMERTYARSASSADREKRKETPCDTSGERKDHVPLPDAPSVTKGACKPREAGRAHSFPRRVTKKEKEDEQALPKTAASQPTRPKGGRNYVSPALRTQLNATAEVLKSKNGDDLIPLSNGKVDWGRISYKIKDVLLNAPLIGRKLDSFSTKESTRREIHLQEIVEGDFT